MLNVGYLQLKSLYMVIGSDSFNDKILSI